MAVHADNYMIFLEFLIWMNTSRRREVKEWVDPLTKYDDSKFHAQFCLWKLTVQHLLSDVCQTVYLPSFCNIIWSLYCENHGKLLQLNDTLMAFFRHHGLQTATLGSYSLTSVIGLHTTTDLWCLIFTFWWSNQNIASIFSYKWNANTNTKCVTSI